MSYRCCVEDCDNTNERFPSNGVYFDGKYTRFPENPEKRKLWNKIIGSNKNVKKFICSEHFTEDDWRYQDIMLNVPLSKRKLKPDAVPSRKLPTTFSGSIVTEMAAVNEETKEQTRKHLVAEALAQYEISQLNYNDNSSSEDNPLVRRRTRYRSLIASMSELTEVRKEMDEQTRKRLVAEALAEYDKPHADTNDNDVFDGIPTATKKHCPTMKMEKFSEGESSIDEMEIHVKECNFFSTQTRKCGEVTLDVDDQTFALNCSLCPGIFLDLLNFSNHVKAQHTSLLDKFIKNPLDTNTEEPKKPKQKLNGLTMPKSAAQRKRKQRERLKDNNIYDKFKAKEAIKRKERRKINKHTMTIEKKFELRAKKREEMRKYRQRKQQKLCCGYRPSISE